MDKYYLRIENENFGFIVEGIHEINEADISITQEEYDNFFNEQRKGKQFRLKVIATGNGLFDYVEEYTPEPIEEVETKPSLEERISALELALLEVL